MLRRGSLRVALALVAAATTGGVAAARTAGAGVPLPAPAPASARAFAELVDRVHVGMPIAVGRSFVLFLWSAADAAHPAVAPGAWVGLDGSSATISELPSPVGDAAVRVVNALDVPLYLPRGEAIVATPGSGDPRIVDRPVWIGARSASFVPVVQPTPVVSIAPYRTSTDRASPETLRAIRIGPWADALHTANHALAAGLLRQDDALAGYDSSTFARVEMAWTPGLETARTTLPGAAVGLATIDDKGLATIVLEGDAARFRALWPSLLRGVLRDAAVREGRNLPPVSPRAAAKGAEEAVAALDELRADAAVRPAFGHGDQLRWPDVPAAARWIGLAVDGRPISTTFHRLVDPPDAAPAPPAPPPGHDGPTPPPTPVPGQTELDRREPRSPFEERLRERREGMGG